MYFSHPVKVFATSGSDELARRICASLRQRLPEQLQPPGGIVLGDAKVHWFSNENPQAKIENIRGHFVVIVHTQTPPVSDNTMELFAILDAVMDSHPADVMVVFPYMPYGRSDRKNQPRISVMAKRFAKFISESFKVSRVLLLNPHSTHVKHYFDPAADEITAIHLILDHIRTQVFPIHPQDECVLTFSDGGSADRFENVPQLLGVTSAYIDKGRKDNDERTHIKRVVGDVRGRHCILIDDEILTGGTTIGDADILLDEGGAASVITASIHPILEDKRLSSPLEVVKKLEQSRISRFIITDTVPVRHKLNGATKFTVLSTAPLLAEAIARIVQNNSLTALHEPDNVKHYRE